MLAGPPTTKGKDVRTLRDPTGKRFAQEMLTNVKHGEVTVVDYLFPKPNSTVPVPKESFVEGLGDVACGVGYYTAVAQNPGDSSRMAREQHACTVVMGLYPTEVSTRYASGVSIPRYLSKIRRGRPRRGETPALRRGSGPVPRLSQPAWKPDLAFDARCQTIRSDFGPECHATALAH